jgi:Tfp pilus assembly protein PilE
MRNFIVITIIVLVVCSSLAYLTYRRSLRQVAIMQGQATLRTASKYYAERGFVRNYGTFTVLLIKLSSPFSSRRKN